LTKEGGIVTQRGVQFLRLIGVEVGALMPQDGKQVRRTLCRPCLDWSERRIHLGGSIGAAICRLSFDQGWIRRIDGTRAVAITPSGRRAYREHFGTAL
jgi:hypothetical protein